MKIGEDIDKYLSERGLSLTDDEKGYNIAKRDMEMLIAINKIYGNKQDGDEVVFPKDLANNEAGNRFKSKINEYLNNPDEVYDKYFNPKYGYINNYLNRDKEGNLFNVGEFEMIKNSDKKRIEANNNYEGTKKQKELKRETDIIQNALGLDENGKFKKSSGIAETANRMFYAQQFGALGKMLESKKNENEVLEKQYVDEKELPSLIDKYDKYLNEHPEEKELRVDNLYKMVLDDEKFNPYREEKYNIDGEEKSFEELVKANFEALLPEFEARQVLDDTENSSKAIAWFNNRLQDNLYNLQGFGEKIGHAFVNAGLQFVSTANYIGGVCQAITDGGYELDENGNLIITEEFVDENENGEKILKEIKQTVENNYKNRLRQSSLMKRGFEIQETGALFEDKRKELKKEGVNQWAIYRPAEDSGYAKTLFNTSTVAEEIANLPFTITAAWGSAGIGALTKVANGAKIFGNIARAANATERGILRMQKIGKYAGAATTSFAQGFLVGGYEGVVESMSTYHEALQNSIEKLRDLGATENVDMLTDEQITTLPIYNEVLKEIQSIRNDENKINKDLDQNLSLDDRSSAILTTRNLINDYQKEAFQSALDASQLNFWHNSFINGVTNTMMKTAFMNNNVRRKIESLDPLRNWGLNKHYTYNPNGTIANVTFKYGAGRKIYEGAKNAAGEMIEEGLQGLSNSFSLANSEYNFDKYLHNRLYGDGFMQIGDDAAGSFLYSMKAVRDDLENPLLLKEMFMGGTSVLMPTPFSGSGRNVLYAENRKQREGESNLQYWYRMNPIKIGIVEEMQNLSSKEATYNKRLETVKTFVNSDKFGNFIKNASYLGNLATSVPQNGFDEDKQMVEFLSRANAMLSEVEDSEYGKKIIDVFEKLSNTNFDTQNEEEKQFIENIVKEYRDSLDENDSRRNLTDKEIFNQRKEAATAFLNVRKSVSESTDYVETMFPDVESSMKDYLIQTHLTLTQLSENKKEVEKELNDIFSKISLDDIQETDGKIHYSDLSDEFKKLYIKYGSNVENIEEKHKKLEEELQKHRDDKDRMKSRFYRKQINEAEKELNNLYKYVDYLKKNKDNLEIFINANEISRLEPEDRAAFFDKKDEGKNKYGSRQNEILNRIKKEANKIVKNNLSVKSDWFNDALNYSGNANKYFNGCLNMFDAIENDQEIMYEHMLIEATKRGEEQGIEEAKKVNFNSGKELYNFINKLRPRTTSNLKDRVEMFKEIARFEAYKKALVDKKYHKGAENAIDEYNDIVNKQRIYSQERSMGSVGFSPFETDRAVSQSVFMFLIENGVNIDNLDECLNYLDNHQKEYFEYVDKYNEDIEDSKNKIPVYNYEDELVKVEKEDEDGEDEYEKRLGVKTIFTNEWNMIDENRRGRNKQQKQQQQEERQQRKKQGVKQPQQPKPSKSYEEIYFGKSNLNGLKNLGINEDELNNIIDFIKSPEDPIRVAEKSLLDALKILMDKINDSEFEISNETENKINDKIKELTKKNKEEENTSRIVTGNDVVYDENRTIGNKKLGLNSAIMNSENIKYVKEHINEFSKEDREYYNSVISFYERNIDGKEGFIISLTSKDDLKVYKSPTGLYVVVAESNNGTMSVDGKTYQPIAVMPKENDIKQYGINTFNSFRNDNEEGFILNEDGEPLIFSLDSRPQFSDVKKEETKKSLKEQIYETGLDIAEDTDLIEFLQNIEVTPTEAHKTLSFNSIFSKTFVKVASIIDTEFSIGGQKRTLVNFFKEDVNDVSGDYIDSLFENELFKSILFGLKKFVESNEGNKDMGALQGQFKTILYPTNNFDYDFSYENGVLKLGLFIKDINHTNINAEIDLNYDEKNPDRDLESELKRAIYEFYNKSLFGTDGNPIRNKSGNGVFNIQLNQNKMLDLSEALKNDGNKENLSPEHLAEFLKFKYLVNNDALYIDNNDYKNKYKGVQIVVRNNKKQNPGSSRTESLAREERTEAQKDTLNKIRDLQNNASNINTNVDRDSYTTATEIAYGEKYKDVTTTNNANRYIGNELDQFCRDFFEDKLFKKPNEDRLVYINSEGVEIDAENYYGMFSNEQLVSIFQSLSEIRLRLSLDNYQNMAFVASNLKFYDKLDDYDKPVSCELDLIGVDNLGKIHIFDFKSGGATEFKQTQSGWKKQLDVYKKMLEKKGFEVKSINVIAIATELSRSAKSTDKMTVDDLLKTDRGRNILVNRYGYRDDMSQEEKDKIENKLNILGWDSGNMLSIGNDLSAKLVDNEVFKEIAEEINRETKSQQNCDATEVREYIKPADSFDETNWLSLNME